MDKNNKIEDKIENNIKLLWEILIWDYIKLKQWKNW